jgi:hypothetical protein
MQNKKIGTFISKYLPEIHQKMMEKGKTASLDEYSNLLKEKIGKELKSDVDVSEIKKYLKNLKISKSKSMDELIDKDGSPIKGDWNPNRREIFVGKDRPQTSREFAMFTAQGPRYYFTPRFGAGRVYTRESAAENKMKNMIEDIVSKDYYDRDMIGNQEETDFESTSIPLLMTLKSEYQRPIIARKTKYLGDMMDREGATGEEIAIIINHLLSVIDIDKIPSEYKKILINKIKNG